MSPAATTDGTYFKPVTRTRYIHEIASDDVTRILEEFWQREECSALAGTAKDLIDLLSAQPNEDEGSGTVSDFVYEMT